MRVPQTLEPLIEMGIIEEVVRPLMSGKEAQLYIVVAGSEERVAKVYKSADQRSFKRRDDYTEGRRVRNSRDRRAMEKRSRHGRSQDEAAWRCAEVDVIYRLRDAGVRVPTPYNFMEGVLVMELVTGADGLPAPRLGDVSLAPDAARDVYDRVLQEVVRMLCAGVVHGDLSDFNVLMGADGPVVIDFPQAVDAASNPSARRLLVRDVENLHRFLSRVTRHRRPPYAQEMWRLFERNELTPETRLRGQFRDKRGPANTREVLALIGEAERDERRRRGGQGQATRGRAGGSKGGRGRATQPEVLVRSGDGRTRTLHPAPPRGEQHDAGAAKQGGGAPTRGRATTPAAPAKKRRRRRRRSSSGQPRPTPAPKTAAGDRSRRRS